MDTLPSLNSGKSQVEVLHQLYEEGLNHKMRLVGEQWKLVDKYFYGQQTRFKSQQRGRRDGWKSDTKENHLYAFYLESLAMMMRDLPRVEPSSRYDNKQLILNAKWLAREIPWILKYNLYAEREEELLHSNFLYGKAFWKLTWDPRLFQGIGGIRFDTVGAKNLVPQPGKMRLRDALYVFEPQSGDKLSLITTYPHLRNEICQVFSKQDDRARMGQSLSSAGARPEEGTHTTGTGLTLYHDMLSGGNVSTDRLPVIEAWMTDDEVIERFGWIMEAHGNGIAYKKAKKNFAVYPTGRYIKYVGNLILEDRPNPFPGFPYIEMVNQSLEGREWSQGELDQLIPLQKIIDTRNNQVMDGVNRSMGGKVFVDGMTGVNVDELSNDPSQVFVSCANSAGVKEVAAPRLPAEVFASQKHNMDSFDRISGYPDFLSNLGAERSGYALEQLSELVGGRMKLKTYSLELCVAELGSQMTRLMGLFYIRGVHTPYEVDTVGMIPDHFDYAVRAGMNLPASKRAQEQIMLQYFDRGLLDEQYMLENTDLPNKETLLQRKEEKWAMEKEIAQLEQDMIKQGILPPGRPGAAPPAQGPQAPPQLSVA